VVEHLRSLGWQILRRNFRGRKGEIDVIARHGKVLVFVEVKAARTRTPYEALQPRQVQRIRSAALEYLQSQRLPLESEMRFDLIRLWGSAPEWEHLIDAF